MIKKNKKEKDMKVRELADIMLKSFNTAQQHVNERFNTVDKKFEILTGEMNKNFKEVTNQINKISLNAVDVVRQKDFDDLKDRVTDVEEVLDLKLKKA